VFFVNRLVLKKGALIRFACVSLCKCSFEMAVVLDCYREFVETLDR